MQQSPPSDNYICSALQEISQILWNLKFSTEFTRTRRLVFYLKQMNSFRNHPSHFPNIHFNIISLSKPRSPQRSPSFKFSTEILHIILFFSHTCYIPCPFRTPLFHHRNIWRGAQIIKLVLRNIFQNRVILKCTIFCDVTPYGLV